VPDLHVDEIELDVENLGAHLAIEARLANLLELRAGAHVAVAKVQYAILDRALTSIDRNPQISVTSGASRGKLARLGDGLRSRRRGGRGGHRVTKVATAAGLLGGAALAAHGNGGIEKTINELTS
jgi:hypothetical protein